MKKTLRYIYIILALAMMAGATQACDDDLFDNMPDFTSVGEDMHIYVPINLPTMTVQSRASISSQHRDEITSLWIAVFDSNGEITSSSTKGGSTGWIKRDTKDNGWSVNEPIFDTANLWAKSGTSRIVAVANVDNYGMAADGTIKRLRELLTNDIKWDDFKKICIVNFPNIGNDNNVSADADPMENTYAPDIEYGLPMSGCYTTTREEHPHPKDWSNINEQTINIPSTSNGEYDFSDQDGAIHLRRLTSNIKFNIKADNDLLKLEVLSFRVRNIPRYSWLYEQSTNYGDVANKENKSDYITEAFYNEQYISKSDDNKEYKFDFWLTENKHTATGLQNDKIDKGYNNREVKTGSLDSDNLIFTNLVGGDGTWNKKNMATYVIIRANVTYPEAIERDQDGYEKDKNPNPPTENGIEPVYRSGVAEYIIHLGYIDKNANDFNSYRNCDYTYNVTIKGLDNIVVEANRDGVRNGVEGIVTDVTNPTIQLDAHFHTFNIAFTEEELQNTANFGYIITTYHSGLPKTYTESTEEGADDIIYRDWVELKPTTDANTLATYVPAKGAISEYVSYTPPQSSAQFDFGSISTIPLTKNDRVMTLHDFYKKVMDCKGNAETLSASFKKNADGKYYFTVFVNEYTYEYRYCEDNAKYGNEGENRTGNRSWHTYVNQPPRRFYFRVKRAESEDKNSVYARAKYSFEQQSIQTYYSNTGNASPTAVGIEHVNETQGLNLYMWSFMKDPNTLSSINGRYNINEFISQIRGYFPDYNYDFTPLWNLFFSPTTELRIPNGETLMSAEKLQNGPAIISLASGWNPASDNVNEKGYTQVPSPATVNQMSPSLWHISSMTNIGLDASSNYDPQSSLDPKYYIEAMNACMNRNRDENGNGKIDNSELKWYVPASGKYLRAILGRNSLTDPIMPYTSVNPGLPNPSNMFNSRYMMYASDARVIWAMEGLSLSSWGQYETDDKKKGQQRPWQVRCIRNLGTNLTTIENIEKVSRAYTWDPAHAKVIMKYYDRASIRTQKYTGSGNIEDRETSSNPTIMPMHPVTSPINKVYSAFEYDSLSDPISASTSIAKDLIFNNERTNATGTITYNNPCAGKGNGWRLPNQKELAIMRNLGLFSFKTISDNVMDRNCYAISCTYDYFKINGNAFTPDSYYLNSAGNADYHLIATRKDGGTRIEDSDVKNLYYRCVRDVEP